MLLNVGYISQQHNWFANDCGEACSAMSANYCYDASITIEQVQAVIGRPNSCDVPFALRNALNRMGYPHETTMTVDPNKLAGFINDRKPVIVLVNYRYVPQKAFWFTGGHYLLLTGHNEAGFYYHDPLFRTAERGANKHISHFDFKKAWVSSFQIVVSKQGKPKEEEIMGMSVQEFFEDHWVPATLYDRRIANKDAKRYVKKTGKGDEIGMYDKNSKLLKRYKSEGDYVNDGWKKWEDVEKGKNWKL